MPAAADLILERDAELAAIAVVSRAAAGGAGALVLMTGPGGIGKTTLLRAASSAAAVPGSVQMPAAQVLTARGIALERDFSFGIVRQLLEPVRAALGPGEWDELFDGAARLARRVFDSDAPHSDRPQSGGNDPFATIHGLYWLVANLAAAREDQGPLLIVVDDVHWADAPSLRWLSHLAARIEDLPVVLLLAVRTGPDQPELIDELFHLPSCVPLPLRPLSAAASAIMARSWLGGEYPGVDDELCTACHEATGGNPFLLESLLESLREAGRPPTVADVAAARPRPVGAALDRRLRQLGEGAAELARAVAVLGAPASLRHAAELAGLDLPRAARLADDLRAAHVFVPSGPLEFSSAIVGTAMYELIPPGERAIAHGRAAGLLEEDADSAELLAPHLLRSEPAGDPRTVEVLRRAAAAARDHGAPDTAADYLRRALAEPPGAGLRPEILLDYGLALASIRDPKAVAVLEDAVDRAPSAGDRARAALLSAGVLGVWGHHDSALRVTREALETPGLPDDARDRLEAALFAESWLNAETAPHAWSVARARPGNGAGSWRVYEALAETVAGRAPTVSREAATVTGTRDTPVAVAALLVLLWNDELTAALRTCDEVLAGARGRGSLNMVADVTHLRSAVLRRMGKLREAADDGRYSLDFKLRTSPPLSVAWAAAALIDALTALGRLDEADQAATAAMERPPPEGWIQTTTLIQARGVLRVAQKRYDEGLRDLLAAADGWRGLGAANPAVASWRTAAIEAYAATGREDEAAELASEQVRLARAAGGRLALGVALRASAPYSGDPSGRLTEAVDLLRRAEAPVELARAQADLGVRLRRAGRRPQAQRQLRAALETADRCGAKELSRGVRRELLATGARPRRSALTGPDALTGAERQVAALAADGLTNRQIAQYLFITQSTVETHLRHAFNKLGVSSRAGLPGDLGKLSTERIRQTVRVNTVSIDSAEDPRLADYARLTDMSLRTSLEAEHGLFIAEGAKVIARAAAAGYPVRSVLLGESRKGDLPSLLPPGTDAPVYLVPDEVAERLTGFRVHRGALASMERKPLPSVADVLAGARRIVVLEDLVDHANVGAIFRSAAALGVDAVLLSPRCADPLYRRAVKVSMGAVFSIRYARMTEWYDGLAGLREAGFQVLALTPDDDATPLAQALTSGNKYSLLLGTEGDGLSSRWRHEADQSVRIPMDPGARAAGVDSLNVVAAAAIACHMLTGIGP